MKHYRLLNIGEIVEDGDEEYSSDELMDDVDCPCPEWRPVSVTFIGEAVQEAIDPPVRREDQGTDTVPTKYHDDLMQSALNVRVKLEAKFAKARLALEALKLCQRNVPRLNGMARGQLCEIINKAIAESQNWRK
jgi:hypothetical protein